MLAATCHQLLMLELVWAASCLKLHALVAFSGEGGGGAQPKRSSLLSVLLLPGARASSKICSSGTLQPTEVVNPVAASGSSAMVGTALPLQLLCRRSRAHGSTGEEYTAQHWEVWCFGGGPCRTGAHRLGQALAGMACARRSSKALQGAAVTPEPPGQLHHVAGDDCRCTRRSGPDGRLLHIHTTAVWRGSAQGSTWTAVCG